MINLALLLFLSLTAEATTLKDAFQAARLNMETLKKADAQVARAKELKTRAFAAVLPTVNGFASYTKIDPPNAAGNNPFLLTRQYSNGVRLTQPLFRGGVGAAYGFAKENVLLAEFQKNASELNLFGLVVNSYYNLIMAQADVKNLEELKRLSRERVKELRDRTSIGRSRKGELREAEAQLLTAESQFQQGTISLQEAERTFEFYTKLPPQNLVLAGDIPDFRGSLQENLEKIKSRPDVMATQQQIRLAEKQVDVNKGLHYPQFDLIGNYYFERTGVLASSKWDVGGQFTLPLFQGGGAQAAVREAVEAKRVAILDSSEFTRSAERDMAVLYQNYIQIREQLKTMKEAMEKSEEAYRLNRKDYQNGLVPNLTVLQSLNVFISSKRSYDSLTAMAHMTYHALTAATGVLP